MKRYILQLVAIFLLVSGVGVAESASDSAAGGTGVRNDVAVKAVKPGLTAIGGTILDPANIIAVVFHHDPEEVDVFIWTSPVTQPVRIHRLHGDVRETWDQLLALLKTEPFKGRYVIHSGLIVRARSILSAVYNHEGSPRMECYVETGTAGESILVAFNDPDGRVLWDELHNEAQ